ncbi:MULTISPECIES: carbohydrate-binding family 9-like protein [unclassified Sphingobacterium]|uniref:carbohydrate-binding family 9-like protein n=1 Tax=unclassified Sphingobacterium TaxID=2609468 RepID=UPI0025EE9011|nr:MULTISPECIES: carbohydrate-binding family 9-like protein [unclassified Sphingobacterium]
MKKLTILPIAADLTKDLDYKTLSELMSDLETQSLSYNNWSESFPYKPEVQFKIGYTAEYLVLQYEVIEEQLRGHYSEANQNVWEDSCVEFFVSFDGCKHYYNLEFNLIGTGLIGYGTAEKAARNRLDTSEIEKVRTFSLIMRNGSDKRWTMIEVIPLSIFKFDELVNLKGKIIHGNFYKCGDHLKQPHFISWNKIENPAPNFHLPQFFGEMVFG